MMISEEQARLAAKYLQTTDCRGGTRRPAHPSADEDLVRRVSESLEELPETREDRLARARRLLEGPMPSASELAEKILGRLVSDSLR